MPAPALSEVCACSRILGPLFRNRDASGNSIPVVVALPALTLTLVGEPERGDFYLDVNGAARQRFPTSTAGTADLPVTLQAGANRICVIIDETTSLDVSEAVQCITIAYIP